MNLTQRGSGALMAFLSESLLAILLLDPIITLLSLSLALMLIVDAAAALRRVNQAFSAVASEIAGNSLRVPLGISKVIEVPRLPAYVELRAQSDWAEVTRTSKGFVIHVKPRLYGAHSVEIECSARSPLGLFKVARIFRLRVFSYPRALPLLVVVAERAIRAKGMVEGKGTPSEARKQILEGFEYFGSREYSPGDKLKRIDWRATAKTGKLHIKEFRSWHGGLAVFFSGEAPGPQVADFIASALLSAAIAAHREGLSVTFFRVTGLKVELLAEASPQEVPAVSVAVALEQLGLSYEALEHILPEPTAIRLAALRKLRLPEIAQALKEKQIQASQAAELAAKKDLVLFIGSLASSIQSTVDIAYELAKRGAQTLFIVHPKPWVDARGFGEEQVMKRTREQALRALKNYCKLSFRAEEASRSIETYAISVRPGFLTH